MSSFLAGILIFMLTLLPLFIPIAVSVVHAIRQMRFTIADGNTRSRSSALRRAV
jgi:hypothetical protein